MSNLEIVLGIALIKIVNASGSKAKNGGPLIFILLLTFISTVCKLIGIPFAPALTTSFNYSN
jgi:hypothetical protein